MEMYNKEWMQANMQALFTLEWLGIRFEDVKEEHGLSGKVIYYFSVPETSTIVTEDETLNEKIKTADGLKQLAKETIIDVIIDSCNHEYGEYLFADIRDNISDYFQFRAKVRSGEVWTKELGDNRMKELTNEIKQAGEYKEV